MPRAYESPERERQAEETRRRIVASLPSALHSTSKASGWLPDLMAAFMRSMNAGSGGLISASGR